MATSQEQPQQQQQQQQQRQQRQPPILAEPAAARAAPAEAAANPDQPAGGAKSFLAVQRETLKANVASRGKRIVCTQAVALVTTTVLGMLCLIAFWQTDGTCAGGPVGLRAWYLGAFVLECALFVLFFCVMYSVLTVWSRQAVGARASSPAGQGEELADGGESGCAVYLGFSLALLAFFAVVWSTVGLLAKRDAGGCDSGSGYFWYIYTVMWVSICCCTGGSAADAHRRQHKAREAPRAPEEELEARV